VMEDLQVSVEEKVVLCRKALKAHTEYMTDAVAGYGVDRHLFGLKRCLEAGEELPEIFKDPAAGFSSHWYLSTSQLTSEYFDGYGWGEVVPDGYGIAYMVKEDELAFNVAARKEMDVEGMKWYLEESVREMRDMFEQEKAMADGKERVKAKL